MFKPEFSFDDGSIFDKKIAQLLEKYGFTGTFYIPSNCDLSPKIIKQISINHYIGGHTETHPMDMKLLSCGDLTVEVRNNKKWLEEITGHNINSFCYPRGRYNDNVIAILKEEGFIEARTTQVLRTTLPEDPFRRDTTIHVFQRSEYNGMAWQNVARSMFKQAKENDGYFHLWGHGWEINRDKNWEKFEKLLEYIRDNIRPICQKNIISMRGENNPRWKGGYENKLAHNRRRLAIKRGASGFHTLYDWELLKKQYNYVCPCCNKSEPKIILTEDHIIPLSKGGSDNIENIQPLCKKCNSIKHDKIIKYD